MAGKKPLTEEQKQELRERLARGREAKAQKAAAAAPAVESESEHLSPSDPDDDAEMLAQPIAALDATVEDRAARRGRLLEGIPADIADLISDAELDDIERKERETAEAERKKKALETVRSQVRHRARVEHSLISADTLRSNDEKKRLAETVRFKVRLPRDGAGDPRNAGFRIDGRVFQEGQVYSEPRAVFESLRDIHYRAWLSELRFRTLDQHKVGNSARELMGDLAPRFEVVA